VIFDVMLRLEPDPHQRDLARGWAAELADPAWMLGRQWQLGEHAGEDASSPVAVEFGLTSTPIEPVANQHAMDPTIVPAQAVLESEPGDWWTAGRRIQIGRAVATTATSQGISLPESTRLENLPVPYHTLNGGPDGRELWRRRTELGLQETWFGNPGPPRDEPVDLWDPAELSYSAAMSAGDTVLRITRHDGGNLDWYHADADGPLSVSPPAPIRVTPGRLRYPSAPLPRWWQVEDAAVSIGGEAPDRAALATLVLIDLIVNHADDWYTFSVPVDAGHIATLDAVTVIDSFGDRWPVRPPQDWSLFATTGLDTNSMVMWATAPTPVAGPILDDVVIGIDEDANVVWAVEQTVAGRTLATLPPRPEASPSAVDSDTQPTFSYLAMTPVPPYWHPYVVEDQPDGTRRFVQGRAADLSGPEPVMLPEPTSDLLFDPNAPPAGPVHYLAPAAIPPEGLRVQRRAMLARSTTGAPVLWTQRRRWALEAPPTLALRFDVLRQRSG
jgi:hypothetical protein